MMNKTLALCVALFSATLLFAKPYTQQGIAYLYDYKTNVKNGVQCEFHGGVCQRS